MFIQLSPPVKTLYGKNYIFLSFSLYLLDYYSHSTVFSLSHRSFDKMGWRMLGVLISTCLGCEHVYRQGNNPTGSRVHLFLIGAVVRHAMAWERFSGLISNILVPDQVSFISIIMKRGWIYGMEAMELMKTMTIEPWQPFTTPLRTAVNLSLHLHHKPTN